VYRDEREPEVVRSHTVRAGRRKTYFIDILRTRGDDFYISLTESQRRSRGDGFDRHTILLYKEDFNRFLSGLEEMINVVKTDLMPDYDYNEFDRRHEEREARIAIDRERERQGLPPLDNPYDHHREEDPRDR
jgi:hypothetical protein